MKKNFLQILLVFSLVLAACSNAAAESEPGGSTSNAGAEVTSTNDSFRFELPLETKLWMGIVELDETDYAVDAEQAAELLPLWKVYRSLGESETAAQAEMDAVITQIERTMTGDQLAAIQEMGLSMQNMSEVAGKLGVEMDFGNGRFADLDPETQAKMEAARESGQFPGGGQGPAGGLPGSGQGPGSRPGGDGAELDPAVRATAIAERGGSRGARFGMSTELLNKLIEFLEARTQ